MSDSGSGLTEHTQVNIARLRELEGLAVTTMRLARMFTFDLWCQCGSRLSDHTWHKEAGDDHIENMATATMILQQVELLHGAINGLHDACGTEHEDDDANHGNGDDKEDDDCDGGKEHRSQKDETPAWSII